MIYSKLIIITLKRINPNTNKLTNTDTMSMSKNTRYEGTIAIMGPIKIRQEVVLVLIGKSGSNIQQIREVVGNDTYIRIFDSTKEKGYTQRIFKKCDKIYISSNNEKSLRKAAMMLKKTMNQFLQWINFLHLNIFSLQKYLLISSFLLDKKQCIIDSTGKIVKDQLLHIKSLEIDEIDIGDLVYEGVYTPQYPEPWYTQQVKDNKIPPKTFKNVTVMGHNGSWEFEFSAPFYMWLLENLY